MIGRYYAMDRDNRWERVEKAYAAITRAEGLPALTADAAVVESYARGETDEFILPHVVAGYAGARTGTGSSASTSAPTARARSWRRWPSPISRPST